MDSFCGLALAATVSQTQATSLRDFMHKYLDFRTLIEVEIPVCTYQLALFNGW